MSHATIANIKHVIRHLKENNIYSDRIMREALKTIKDYDIDVRTLSFDCDYNGVELIRAAECGRPGQLVELEYDVNFSEEAYILAGFGGCY